MHGTRQGVEMREQILPQRVHVPLVATGQHGDVAFAQFKQLKQPVFDRDFRMCPRLTQGRGGFERFRAVRV